MGKKMKEINEIKILFQRSQQQPSVIDNHLFENRQSPHSIHFTVKTEERLYFRQGSLTPTTENRHRIDEKGNQIFHHRPF
jgi:hypothetical protein